MRKISEIRHHLHRIPDAIEDGEGSLDKLVGDAPGHSLAKTVWDDESSRNEPTLMHEAPDTIDSDEIQKSPAALDHQLIFETPPEIELDKAQTILGGNAGNGIRAKVRLGGVDALAYYVPFHQTFIQWGIYIPESSVHHLAFEVFGGLRIPAEEKFRLAFQALHAHELFHFATEYMAAQIEFFANKALYLRKIRNDKSSPLGFDDSEEQGANAHMLRALLHGSRGKRVRGAYPAICEYIKLMPEGYRDAGHLVSAQRFAESSCALARAYSYRLESNHFADGADLLKLFPFEPGIDWRYCPIHIVPDAGDFGLPPLGIQFIQRVDPVFEVPRFSKFLQRQPANIAHAWTATKSKLATSAQLPGLDFKKWSPGGSHWYSVRVTGSVRAHLRFDKDESNWYAEEIGEHKTLGHG